MQLIHLSVKNFLSLKSVDLPLSDRGLVLVLGQNKDADGADSNGSGKSSLFDALCWCLWGTTTRGVKGDAVVNLVAKRNCEVTVSLEDGGIPYEVTRLRKHTSHSKANDLILKVNGEDGRGASISDTQERVNRLLGLDFHTFRSMMPGAGINAAALTDREIKNLLEGILGISSFAQAQTLSRELKKELVSKREEKQAVLMQQVCRLEDERARALQYEKAIAAFNQSKTSRSNLIANKLADLETQSGELSARAGTLPDVLQSIQEIKNKIDQADLLYQKFAQELTERKDTFTEVGTRITSGLNLLNFQMSEKENLLTTMSALGDTCASCGQSVDKAKCDLDIKLLAEDIQTLGNVIALDKATLDGAKKEWEVHSTSLSQKIRNTETLKSQFTEKLLDKVKLRGALSNLDAELTKVATEKNILREEQAKVLAEQSPVEGLLTQCRELVFALDNETTEQAIAVAELSEQIDQADFWVNGFSPQGLRSYALAQICPLLNERVAHYANIVSGEDLQIVFSSQKSMKNKTTKELFNIEVRQKSGSNTYLGSSSGERARADLAISFALGDLAALRATKKISFKFLDEAFGSVDESGIDAIMALLHEQSNSYGTIFVVTHKDYFKKYIDSSLTVVKENGQSRLEV
jgi:DNA repair exonuclease SbcCD ATPase subunit